LSRLKPSPVPPKPDPRREPEGLVAGDIVAQRYRLEEVVGRGGMGQVWAAYDRKLGRQVALKIVDLDRSEASSARARFAREAALSQQLRGPSFVEVYDQGSMGNQAFLVMELLIGETLHQRLHRVGTLPPDELLQVVRSVAGCLRLAHTLQIVHRDLKPGNVFFARVVKGRSGVRSKSDADEIVKLIDFGIAKDSWDDARLTRPGLLLGSTFYMSPEQIRSGHDVDARTDLWALAVIMYRALTGQRPFSGAPADAMAKILARDPAVPSSLNPMLSPSIDDFFRKALEKDPSRRFQSIDELVDAYTAALRGRADDEPISADGSSVLAAIERLGPLPSSKPPVPETPPRSVHPPRLVAPAVARLRLVPPPPRAAELASDAAVEPMLTPCESAPPQARAEPDATEPPSLPSAWLRARRRITSRPPKRAAEASGLLYAPISVPWARRLGAVAIVAVAALLVLALYAWASTLGWSTGGARGGGSTLGRGSTLGLSTP
jgi:eukaryotic-like serine/threonine-protein kinase